MTYRVVAYIKVEHEIDEEYITKEEADREAEQITFMGNGDTYAVVEEVE